MYSTESATSASWPFGVIARLVGGPKIEFDKRQGRDDLRVGGIGTDVDDRDYVLAGRAEHELPAASHVVLLSMPTTMYSGLPGSARSMVAQAASVATAHSSANGRS